MATARKISSAEWDSHKARISALYLEENLTLDEVGRRMENEHGFSASKAQYVRKLRQWHVGKNSTNDKWKFAASVVQKRKLEGKETEILINERLISAKKLKKAISRYVGPRFEAEGESVDPMDVPDGVVVRTPPAEAIGGIEFAHIPWFQFQDILESCIIVELMGQTAPAYDFGLSASSSDLSVAWDMDIFADLSGPSNLSWMLPQAQCDLPTGVSENPAYRLPQSTSSDQPSAHWDGTLHASPHPGSPTLEQTDREARRLLGECLGELIDPDCSEYTSKIASNLENIAIERHSGEVVRHVQKLYSKSTLDASFQLLRYAVYLSSNNLLAASRIDKLLAWVIRGGKFCVIEHLIEKKMPTTEIFASNLLLSATRLEEIDTVRALIVRGVDPNTLAGMEVKTTALHEATRKGNSILVRLLLDAGANPNVDEIPTSTTVLELAVTRCHRCAASLAIAEMLIGRGADVNAPVDDWGRRSTLLKSAIHRGDIALAQVLLKAGARVNEATGETGTALQVAASHGNTELVEILIEAGADVDSPIGMAYEDACREAAEQCHYSFFLTPLQIAAVVDKTEMAQVLLEAGANVNGFPSKSYYLRRLGFYEHGGDFESHSDSDSDSDVEDAEDDTDDKDYDPFLCNKGTILTALQAAVANNNAVLVRLLLSLGADVNAIGGQGTALQIASAKHSRRKFMELLLMKGADVNNPAQGLCRMTALQEAAQSGNEDVVQLLLNEGAEINAPPNPIGGRAAIQAAAQSKNLDLVKLLVNLGADVNTDAAPVSGRTCLQAAAEQGDIEMVNFLLQSGANVNGPAARTSHGLTALQAAVRAGHDLILERLLEEGADVNGIPSPSYGVPALCAAIDNNRYELAQLLLDKGANPDGYWDLPTPLSTCVRQLKYDPTATKAIEMARCLIHAGADVNKGSRGESGTPLQMAAQTGLAEVVRCLLDAKADVNAPAVSMFGSTALHRAVNRDHIDIVKLLLSKDANPNQSNWIGDGALHIAVSRWAINDEVIQILVDHGADVNANHGSALQVAAEKGSVQTVQVLLAAGADINAPALGIHGKTALQGAVRTGNIGLVKTLLDAGADINAPPGPGWGGTAIQAAAGSGDVRMVQFLLSHGADVNSPASKSHGATALQKAAIGGHLRIALMLLKMGADVNAAPAPVGGRTALEAAAEHGRLDLVHLLLRNDGEPETIETRCKRAAKLASSSGHLILAKQLREWKKS
ncbi:ankyrin repeat-containing domain protein [Phialemonium atrogriseum]|uniref:Ankyrin repeat-containing domain protein n=1 Tax=Phialemonium atrogriseum TaxID=1093897 RepID=A0AAJ0C072_9PEZI|nr:ankyrin repeat-containing domain protein [Phialemonium atrogriseum]KAK1765276.1 ankyrin repeat-containing domain protein [Phialemonium atrogriseum]